MRRVRTRRTLFPPDRRKINAAGHQLVDLAYRRLVGQPFAVHTRTHGFAGAVAERHVGVAHDPFDDDVFFGVAARVRRLLEKRCGGRAGREQGVL